MLTLPTKRNRGNDDKNEDVLHLSSYCEQGNFANIHDRRAWLTGNSFSGDFLGSHLIFCSASTTKQIFTTACQIVAALKNLNR